MDNIIKIPSERTIAFVIVEYEDTKSFLDIHRFVIVFSNFPELFKLIFDDLEDRGIKNININIL